MRVLLVHPSPLMYSEIYLRLEPLGLERVAAAVREAGHDVRLLDLQIFNHKDYFRELETLQAPGGRLRPELPRQRPRGARPLPARRGRLRPECFIFTGGHSGSFIAAELLEHGAGALDCVVRGEGELITPQLLEAVRRQEARRRCRAIVTADGAGPTPTDARRHRPVSAGPGSRPAGVTSTSSASSTRAPPSSSRAAARGTARSAARGRSTGGATAGLAGGGRRGRGAHPGAQRLHRGRRRVRPPRARLRHRSRAGAPEHPQAVLPGDALRRAGA